LGTAKQVLPDTNNLPRSKAVASEQPWDIFGSHIGQEVQTGKLSFSCGSPGKLWSTTRINRCHFQVLVFWMTGKGVGNLSIETWKEYYARAGKNCIACHISASDFSFQSYMDGGL